MDNPDEVLEKLFIKARTCNKTRQKLLLAGWDEDNHPSTAECSGEPPVSYDRLK